MTVEWEEFSDEDLKLEEEAMESGGVDYWKPKDGINVIRVLPKLKGWPGLFRHVREHYINTPTGRRNYVCPRVFNEQCAQCDYANELRGSPSKADQDLAYQLFSKKQVYTRLVDRAEPDKGVQIYKFGKMVHSELKDLLEEEGDFTHPVKGYDLKLRKKGSTQYDTEYKVKSGKHCELGNMDWLAEHADLHEKFGQRILPEDLAKKLAGTVIADRLPDVALLAAGASTGHSGKKTKSVEDDLWGDEDDF
jgi:hypothetical protein